MMSVTHEPGWINTEYVTECVRKGAVYIHNNTDGRGKTVRILLSQLLKNQGVPYNDYDRKPPEIVEGKAYKYTKDGITRYFKVHRTHENDRGFIPTTD